MKLFLLIPLILLFACSDQTWYKTESGLVYKIIPSSIPDSIARIGRTIKVHYTQKVGDTIIESTYEQMPYYEMVLPGYAHPYNPSAIFTGLKRGDSVMVKQRVDSMLSKKILKQLPPYIKKSDEWITTIKVLDVFSSDSLLQLDKLQEMERVKILQQQLSQKRLQSYFKKNGINAAEINQGTYIHSVQNGSGEKPVTGNWLKVDLIVKTIKGKLISSTSDTSFQGRGPINFSLGAGSMPPAIEKAILYFRQGDHMKIYVPAIAIVGVQPGTKNIRIDDDLEFDIKIHEVNQKAPALTKNLK